MTWPAKEHQAALRGLSPNCQMLLDNLEDTAFGYLDAMVVSGVRRAALSLQERYLAVFADRWIHDDGKALSKRRKGQQAKCQTVFILTDFGHATLAYRREMRAERERQRVRSAA